MERGVVLVIIKIRQSFQFDCRSLIVLSLELFLFGVLAVLVPVSCCRFSIFLSHLLHGEYWFVNYVFVSKYTFAQNAAISEDPTGIGLIVGINQKGPLQEHYFNFRWGSRETDASKVKNYNNSFCETENACSIRTSHFITLPQ